MSVFIGRHRDLERSSCGRPSFRDLTARDLSGVKLITIDAHAWHVSAIWASLPGAPWQRFRTHDVANLMSETPKSWWGWVKALLHSIYDQPDAAALHAQFDLFVDALAEKLPKVAEHLEEPPRRHPCLRRVPQGDLAPDLIQQPRRAPHRKSDAAPTAWAFAPRQRT